MAVRIVSDSTCDVPANLREELGVTVVPLKVFFGTSEFRDGIDITDAEFYQRLTSSKVSPTTSQPSAGEFEATFRPILEAGDQVLCLTVSSKLSGTWNSARAAAMALEDVGTVELIDTQLASLAHGLVVIRVARAAKRGMSLDDLKVLAEETARDVDIILVVDTLEYLQRGGRIGKAQQLLGSLLNIKPILRVEEGEVRPFERVRTRGKAIARLEQWLDEQQPLGAIGVVSSPPNEDGDALEARLRAKYPAIEVFRTTAGPVIGTHTGPGLLGVGVFRGSSFD